MLPALDEATADVAALWKCCSVLLNQIHGDNTWVYTGCVGREGERERERERERLDTSKQYKLTTTKSVGVCCVLVYCSPMHMRGALAW